ncbi:MAG: ABC transporter substrate-binding protein [Oscillospiraceae bacterium]|jgi:branched-chain amino acid transport system substrate-binding protein|nr:ABC transporter substrate-binding protein [Oscillospiraceae bacterium]
MRKVLALLIVALLIVPAFALSEDTIKIGIFEPITGSYAGGGAMEVEGYELAKELYPTVLGLPVEFVIADNKSDKVEATNAAASLVSSGVVAVLGSYSSGLSLAGADVFTEAQIPALSGTATNPMVTQNDWYARICFIDPFQGTMLARYAVDQGYKKIAIIQEIESEYAIGLSTYFQQEVAKHEGYEITSIGNFVNTDQDFSTLLTDALKSEPDIIMTPVGYAPSAALIVKQARELGYTGPIFGGDTLDAPELYEIAGEYAEGVIFTTFYDSAQPATEKTSEFLDAYRAKYGKEPSGTNIMCYDAYLCLLNAIETAGSTDSTAIRDAIFATNGFVGAAGVITLDENHDAVRPVVFKEIAKDGSANFLALVEP